jgi:peptide/nickel transport system substrate-binding protein
MRLAAPTTLAVLVLAAGLATAANAGAQRHGPGHAIAMHGEPALPPDFHHFRYVNPTAPQGGRLTYGLIGTFDSLNPFVVKGLAVQAIRGYLVESLMARGYDEPFTLYGLLAESVETDAARTFVTFTLNRAARFSDGEPVTAGDVIFSWELLRDKGRPNHRTYYSKVVKATALDARTVRFDFAQAHDRELPLILGLMPVLARHATDPSTFEQTSFVAPVGSGPYVVAEVRPGDSVTLRRNADYWARDLAVTRGLWNFDELRFDYYRDANAHLEAFKKGLFDLRAENDPARWELAYDIPAVRQKQIIKDVFTSGLPAGMSGFVFNTRRPIFADIRVREAVGMLFDFEWLNHAFFFDRYRRTAGYFDGSELSAHRRPASEEERRLLAPYPGTVRQDVLDGTWSPPATDGSGRDRDTLKRALALFAAAGWEIDGSELRQRQTGARFAFEILVTTKEQERLALAFSRDLKRAGIEPLIRNVDAAQYERRLQTFDFDMIQYHWGASLSPGNEQSFYWGSRAADEPGSRNYMGARQPAIDAMIAAMLAATGREDFVAAVRALDRVLISGFYVVPLFHLPEQWVARWARIGRPATTSLFGYLPETWWREPAGGSGGE